MKTERMRVKTAMGLSEGEGGDYAGSCLVPGSQCRSSRSAAMAKRTTSMLFWRVRTGCLRREGHDALAGAVDLRRQAFDTP